MGTGISGPRVACPAAEKGAGKRCPRVSEGWGAEERGDAGLFL